MDFRLLLMSGQVRLYPLIIPFCPSGGGRSHTSVTLCEKKVVLEQLTGGKGTVEVRRRRRRTTLCLDQQQLATKFV